MENCCDVIAATLKELGISRLFGLVGGEVLDLIESCRKQDLEYITTRHESMAAYMAEVTGQMTGLPGVCISTLGPGASNMINGVANAYLDRQPVLAFAGQLATDSREYANHQVLDLEAMYAPVVKKTFTLTNQGIGDQIREGFELALAEPQGPVFFCLPKDVGQSEPEPGGAGAGQQARPEIAAEALAEARAVLAGAQRPLVLCGVGLHPDRDAGTVRELVTGHGLPVMATPKAKGIIPEDYEFYLGTCGGMMADDPLVELIMEADLVIGLGFDPVESDKIWHRDINLLSINGYSLAYNRFIPTRELIGPIDRTLAALAEVEISTLGWNAARLAEVKARVAAKLNPLTPLSEGKLSPKAVLDWVRNIVPPETILTTDTGAHKLLAGQAWKSFQPLTFFMSNGLSSMGYGVPSAIAAQLARPGTPTIGLTGDGGLGMVIQELETAVRLKLPVVFMVLVDEQFGLIDVVQQRRGLARHGVTFGPIDFPLAARAFGARGTWISSLDELAPELEAAFRSDRPTVLAVPVDGAEYHRQL